MQSIAPKEVDMETEEEQATEDLVAKVLQCRPRYIGIYAPGDFNLPTYRLVIPDRDCHTPGRGYHGVREMIALESPARSDVDKWIAAIEALVNGPNGPVAIRHILNPSSSKDEGLRLVWRKTQQGTDHDMEVDTEFESGSEEMRDWPRRDKLIRDGKTVQAESFYATRQHDMQVAEFMQPWLIPLPFGAISPMGTLSPVSPVTPISPFAFVNAYPPKPEPCELDMEGLAPAE